VLKDDCRQRDPAQARERINDSQGFSGGTQAAVDTGMRNIFLASVFAMGTLLVTGAIAQHEEHHGTQATPAPDKSAAMPMGQMMGQMMTTRGEVAKLTDQLVKGFAAIENEKDAKVRNEKLAEHGKLLKELQSKLQAQSQMMEHMQGMMMGGAMPMHDKKP
jgi:hypothetical protein